MGPTLITGAAGFTGRHLIRGLRQRGVSPLIGCDRADHVPGLALDQYIPLDMASSTDVRAVLADVGPRTVFHLAGVMSDNELEMYAINSLAAINLFDAVRAIVPDCGIVTIGSAAEYGDIGAAELPITEEQPCNPQTAYGISKHFMVRAALDFARRHRLRIAVARPFNLIGAGVPRTLVVGALLERSRAALQSGADTVRIGNPASKRDFLDITDAVEAYIRIAEEHAWGEVFNVCSGRAYAIGDVAECLISFAPRPLRLEVDPALFRSDDQPVIYGSFEKARRMLGFQPRMEIGSSLHSSWNEVMAVV